MRRLADGTEHCDQGCATARQDRSDEGEAGEGLFEKECGESGVEDEAGLTPLAESCKCQLRTSSYRLQRREDRKR